MKDYATNALFVLSVICSLIFIACGGNNVGSNNFSEIASGMQDMYYNSPYYDSDSEHIFNLSTIKGSYVGIGMQYRELQSELSSLVDYLKENKYNKALLMRAGMGVLVDESDPRYKTHVAFGLYCDGKVCVYSPVKEIGDNAAIEANNVFLNNDINVEFVFGINDKTMKEIDKRIRQLYGVFSHVTENQKLVNYKRYLKDFVDEWVNSQMCGSSDSRLKKVHLNVEMDQGENDEIATKALIVLFKDAGWEVSASTMLDWSARHIAEFKNLGVIYVAPQVYNLKVKSNASLLKIVDEFMDNIKNETGGDLSFIVMALPYYYNEPDSGEEGYFSSYHTSYENLSSYYDVFRHYMLIDEMGGSVIYDMVEVRGNIIYGDWKYYDMEGLRKYNLLYSQKNQVCMVSIDPMVDAVNRFSGGGNIYVITDSSCSWKASSDVAWITILTGNEIGTGQALFSFTENTSGETRVGHITINDKLYKLTQSGDYSIPNFVNPPENVQASDGAYADQVMVTWDEVSGATSYVVLRSVVGTAVREILSNTENNKYFFDLTAEIGTQYYYWIYAKNDTDTSDPSNSDIGYR